MGNTEKTPDMGSQRPRHNQHGMDQTSDPNLQREHQQWQEEQADNPQQQGQAMSDRNETENQQNQDPTRKASITNEEE